MNKYVVAKYIRLSIEDSKYESLSIENQRLMLDRHIDSLDIANIETLEFVDNGYTGTNFERPAVQQLLELVRENKINCIIVKDFSRFGRNSIETGYFIERVFPLFKTRFISVSDGFDGNDYREDTGGLEVAFKFLMHEYYSTDLSRKEKSAKYAKFRSGEYQSVICPYGYIKSTDGRIEPDPETADIVKMIFEVALETRSAADIVKVLYEKKIPTPGEHKKANGKNFHDVSRSIGIWQRSSVRRIIGDERYMGTYIMGKRTVREIGSNRNKIKDESEWFKIPNHHEAIISKELFDKVNSKMLHFKSPKKTREYSLRTKIYCGCCRHAMCLAPRKIRAFCCRYTKVDKTAECYGLEIGESELENLLFEIISKQAQIILNTDNLSDISALSVKTEQQAEYTNQIECLNNEKRRLYERFILKEITVGDYKDAKERLDEELSHLTQIHAALSTETVKLEAVKSAGSELRNIAEKVSRENILTGSIIDLLIDKIYVYSNNRIEIAWKIVGFNK
ncbi:MAG: recombinase family protein [Oscillospiraceae bacterium]|nr:recombinase family protein [Oscillospiraceae bacterium]